MTMDSAKVVDCTCSQQLKLMEYSPNSDISQYYAGRRKILNSWARCGEANVETDVDRIRNRLDYADLQIMLKCNRKLIAIAKPFMRDLYQVVAGSGFVVALADRRGYIMEVLGDWDRRINPMTESFYHGANWSEAVAGTNAIGTVLVIKEPIQVTGSEHYCRMHYGLTCSAAPIFDPQGNILGTIDISGNSATSAAMQLDALGMVVAAAEAIMAQLNIQEKNNKKNVMHRHFLNIFNEMPDGNSRIDRVGTTANYSSLVYQMFDAVPGAIEARL